MANLLENFELHTRTKPEADTYQIYANSAYSATHSFWSSAALLTPYYSLIYDGRVSYNMRNAYSTFNTPAYFTSANTNSFTNTQEVWGYIYENNTLKKALNNNLRRFGELNSSNSLSAAPLGEVTFDDEYTQTAVIDQTTDNSYDIVQYDFSAVSIVDHVFWGHTYVIDYPYPGGDFYDATDTTNVIVSNGYSWPSITFDTTVRCRAVISRQRTRTSVYPFPFFLDSKLRNTVLYDAKTLQTDGTYTKYFLPSGNNVCSLHTSGRDPNPDIAKASWVCYYFDLIYNTIKARGDCWCALDYTQAGDISTRRLYEGYWSLYNHDPVIKINNQPTSLSTIVNPYPTNFSTYNQDSYMRVRINDGQKESISTACYYDKLTIFGKIPHNKFSESIFHTQITADIPRRSSTPVDEDKNDSHLGIKANGERVTWGSFEYKLDELDQPIARVNPLLPFALRKTLLSFRDTSLLTTSWFSDWRVSAGPSDNVTALGYKTDVHYSYNNMLGYQGGADGIQTMCYYSQSQVDAIDVNIIPWTAYAHECDDRKDHVITGYSEKNGDDNFILCTAMVFDDAVTTPKYTHKYVRDITYTYKFDDVSFRFLNNQTHLSGNNNLVPANTATTIIQYYNAIMPESVHQTYYINSDNIYFYENICNDFQKTGYTKCQLVPGVSNVSSTTNEAPTRKLYFSFQYEK